MDVLKGDVLKGVLSLQVEEASGKNKEDTYVWDPSTKEGFVKVEIRGERVPNVKVETDKKPVLGTSIIWKQKIELNVLEGANELRLMVCRPKLDKDGNKKGTAVIAACGIYVRDILENVPIDKYFELFKPNAGGDGGFIRIGIDFRPAGQPDTAAEPAAPVETSETTTAAAKEAPAPETVTTESSKEAPPEKKGGPLKALLPLALVGGVIGFVLSRRK